MRQIMICLFLLGGTPLWAKGERAGDFDYFVLALSWSPNWCEREGDARGSEQCDPSRDLGFVLHGLWPQYEQGWPSYCPTAKRPPSRAMTAAEADIYGTGGSAWHQWKKHGVCVGIDADAFYAKARDAYGQINRPELLRKIDQRYDLPASVIEEAFLEANPDLSADGVTVTCKEGMIQEVRICLDQDLNPRRCGQDVIRDCTLKDAAFFPIR